VLHESPHSFYIFEDDASFAKVRTRIVTLSSALYQQINVLVIDAAAMYPTSSLF